MSQSDKGFKFKAAAYCRVSSIDQVQGTLTIKGSLEEQEQKARDYTESRGWEFTQAYIEPGVSGEKFEERVALQRMIDDARQGSFQILIIRAGDRLARDQEVFFRITKILNQFLNIQILNLSNPAQIVEPSSFVGKRNPMLVIQQGVDAMMAAFDQARRIDMLQEGKRRQARAGRFTQTHVFYGYKFEYHVVGGRKVDRVPVPDPDEYWVIELLPKLVLEENLSDREIITRLENLGAKTRGGKPWMKSTIAHLINQPFYGGKLSYGRTAMKVDETGKGRPVKNPNPETIILSDHRYEHPWDWAAYERMQEKRKERRSNPPKQAVSHSPLAGLLVCGYCGHSMVIKKGTRNQEINHRWVTWKDGTKHYRPYKTNNRRADYFLCGYHNASPAACQTNRIPLKLVFDWLVLTFRELAAARDADPEGFYANIKVADQSARRTAVETRLKATRAELAETLPAKIDRLNRGYLNGMVSEQQYPALTKIIDEEKDQLLKTIMELEREIRTIKEDDQRIDRVRNFMVELDIMIALFEKPIKEWPDGEARKVLQWLKTRYQRISVRLEPAAEGAGRKLIVSSDLVAI